MSRRGSLTIVAPTTAVFAYFADPQRRPEWQSSLRRVEDVTPAEPALGQSWTDVTAAMVRPRMRTTAYDPPSRWAEEGTWGPFTAWLRMDFAPQGAATHVSWEMDLTASGPAALAAAALRRAAPYAIAADLRAAARHIEARD